MSDNKLSQENKSSNDAVEEPIVISDKAIKPIPELKGATNQKIEWIVVLRAIACMAVVMIHLIGSCSHKLEDTNKFESVRKFIDLILLEPFIRFAVPCFIMISGCLLLDPKRKVTINKLIRYITRTILLYLFLLFFYVFISNLELENLRSIASFIKWVQSSLKLFITVLIDDTNFIIWLWYFPMLVGLYLLTPILRTFTEHANRQTIYFVLIALFITTCVIPTVNSYFNLNILNFSEFSSVVFLYLIGYFVVNTDLIKSSYIYIGGIIGFIGFSIATYFGVSDQLDMFIVLESMMIFKIFSSGKIRIKNNIIINSISKYSLGIYVVHMFWLSLLFSFEIDFTIFPMIIGEFIFWAYAMIMSLLTSMILYRLPLIKKLFVK